MRGDGGVAGSQSMSTALHIIGTAVHRSPNKLWRSNFTFNLCGGTSELSEQAELVTVFGVACYAFLRCQNL
jgi:hypothetical protein